MLSSAICQGFYKNVKAWMHPALVQSYGWIKEELGLSNAAKLQLTTPNPFL
jgi:hypothetical protein